MVPEIKLFENLGKILYRDQNPLFWIYAFFNNFLSEGPISSSFKMKYKVIIGVMSTALYIQLLFILKMIQAVFSTSPSVLNRMATCTIHVVSMRFRRQWSITFINYYHKSKSCFIFLINVGDNIKITKTSWIFLSSNRTLV